MKKLGLYFAVDKYELNSVFPDLTYCSKDVHRISSILEDDFGYINYILEEENCKKENIQNLFTTILNKEELSPDDSILIFLSGHGKENIQEQKGFFVPYDGKSDNPDSWVDFQYIIKWCNKFNAGSILIIVDVCNAGYFLHKHITDIGSSGGGKIIQVLASVVAGQAAQELASGENSIFADTIIRALLGYAGIGEDKNPHAIKFSDLLAYIQQQVSTSVYPRFQWPIGGYITRDISSRKEYVLSPKTPRLHPVLVKRFVSGEPILALLALSDLIDVFGLELRFPMKINVPSVSNILNREKYGGGPEIIGDLSKNLERFEIERENQIRKSLDKHSLFLRDLQSRSQILFSKKKEPGVLDPHKIMIGINLILDFLSKDAGMCRSLTKSEKVNKYETESIEGLLKKTIGSLISHMDLVEGGIEAIRKFNLCENASIDMLLHIESAAIFHPKVNGNWQYELIESVYPALGKENIK